MAPEQIQACIEACKRAAEAGEAFVRTLTEGSETAVAIEAREVVGDAVAMSRITASTLMRVSAASKACCEACAQLTEMAAQACSNPGREVSAQCRRAMLHCAEECRRLAEGLPQARYLA